MFRLKKVGTGAIHVGDTMYLTLCGIKTPHKGFYQVPVSRITCKNCIKVLKKRERTGAYCKYSKCTYYHKRAETYCCNSCYADAFDDERLAKEGQEMEEKRKEMVKFIKNYNKTKGLCYLVMDSKAIESLAYFVEKHADIYEDTTLCDIIDQVINKYNACLKENLL